MNFTRLVSTDHSVRFFPGFYVFQLSEDLWRLGSCSTSLPAHQYPPSQAKAGISEECPKYRYSYHCPVLLSGFTFPLPQAAIVVLWYHICELIQLQQTEITLWDEIGPVSLLPVSLARGKRNEAAERRNRKAVAETSQLSRDFTHSAPPFVFAHYHKSIQFEKCTSFTD